MAKDFQKGTGYRLYLNTASYSTPTWVEITAVGDVSADPNPDDITVPERGMDMGHLHGEFDPSFNFQLMEDKGDTNVETLIAAIYSGAMVHLAVSRGLIATAGTRFLHMECVLRGSLSANRADVASYDATAQRHANSDNGLVRATAS